MPPVAHDFVRVGAHINSVSKLSWICYNLCMSIEEPHKFACPACDYTLESRMEICPECGYHVVPEDRTLAERRGVFLELTREIGRAHV